MYPHHKVLPDEYSSQAGQPLALWKQIPGYSRVFAGILGGYPVTRFTAATRLIPGAQILGKHEVIPVPVTGISKPGNTREYPDNWQKGNTSHTHPPQRYYVRISACVLTLKLTEMEELSPSNAMAMSKRLLPESKPSMADRSDWSTFSEEISTELSVGDTSVAVSSKWSKCLF